MTEIAEIKKTSKDWHELVPKEWKLIIYDPDGWDRSNYDYSFNQELITKKEFMDRVFRSTLMCNGHAMRDIKWE